MKKIVFMIINMNIGGTEKALINMLNEMSNKDYEITILMLEKKGGFLDYIPKFIKVKEVEEYNEIKKYFNQTPKNLILNLFKEREYIEAINISIIYYWCKITSNMYYFYKHVLKNINLIDEEFDVAVAYAGPMDLITYFVANKIKANKKIQWIHFDITKIGFNKKISKKLYKKFNKIFVVSIEARDKIINKIPCIKEKTDCLLNIISSDLIKDMSEKDLGFRDNFKGIRILTVGRLSKEKGQDLTISVMKMLKSEGYKVRWYCIGDGSAKKEYEKYISEYNLEDDYILLGTKINPYPYMKQCDIYVQPSRYEGNCITLSEARCFDNPIVITNFNGANEQINNGETGFIVECNRQEIFNGIKALLDNEDLLKQIKKNLKIKKVDSIEEIKKFYEVINN